MKNLLLFTALCFLSSCCPHHLEKFEKWSKECEEYRERNSKKLLIPYVEDVIHGKD
jgi:hypothetical protein